MALLPTSTGSHLVQAATTLLPASFATYFIFHRYEPSTLVPILCLLVLVPAVVAGYIHWHSLTAPYSFIFFTHWFVQIFLTLAYRISPFHPLAKFPGPFLAKLSKFRMTASAVGGHKHLYQQALHEIHGDVVRTGPNELSFATVDSVEPVIGTPGLPKGPFYNTGSTPPSLPHIKKPEHFGPRRKLWNQALSVAALKNYEQNIVNCIHELMQALEVRKSTPVDITDWMELFGMEVMGHNVFSVKFDMLRTGKDTHKYRETVVTGLKLVYRITQTPWIFDILTSFVDFGFQLIKMSEVIVKNRMKVGATSRDLFYYLGLEEGSQKSNKLSEKELVMEGWAALLGGADTASIALTTVWYNLMRHPECHARLRKEVDDTFLDGEEPVNQKKLSCMPYLNACINESMRTMPPSPCGSPRVVPAGSGGKKIGAYFVPEGNSVIVHTYTMHRDPRYFYPFPDAFWPDRWLSPEDRKSFGDYSKPFADNDKVIHDTRAYIAFSTGVRVCPGKTLAMLELRVTIACIIQKFDMKPAVENLPGVDGSLAGWESTLEDNFALGIGPLYAILTNRV